MYCVTVAVYGWCYQAWFAGALTFDVDQLTKSPGSCTEPSLWEWAKLYESGHNQCWQMNWLTQVVFCKCTGWPRSSFLKNTVKMNNCTDWPGLKIDFWLTIFTKWSVLLPALGHNGRLPKSTLQFAAMKNVQWSCKASSVQIEKTRNAVWLFWMTALMTDRFLCYWLTTRGSQ
jgi:hypothetical protein